MEWMYRHKHAYRKAMEAFYRQSFYPDENCSSGRYSDWVEGDPSRVESLSTATSNSRLRYLSRPQPSPYNSRRREVVEQDSEMDEESEDEEDIVCDLSNMEITEELRQYFEQTEKHREELRKC